MPLTKEEKKTKVKELEEKLKKQKSAVFVSVDGLKNKDLSVLRENLKEAGSELIVSKKTLTKMAFSNSKMDLDEGLLDGQIGLVFGYEDELSSAKIVYNFSKKNKEMNILGGLLENRCINGGEISSLALIPPKEILYAKVVSSISAPLSNTLSVLQGNIKGLLYALSSIKK